MLAEIQLNTPEIIYAKELPATAKQILGEEKYAELPKKIKIEGGRGHQLYEEYRLLSFPTDAARMAEIEAESKAYYDAVRAAASN